ncbi:MAG: nicotinate (nicotinamide) nucleotide adenylyltransferase [Clostridia bacterium]|nr:nicotinate (nicotinamide) nucleotide adenylyltransferase [Clostridia bacterium]
MKIGLYGGTFSPPHLGHIRAARCFVDGVGLDKLIIMPAGIPPHKAVLDPIPNEKRFEMSKIAFSEIGEVSDYEMNKEGASFTYLTVRWLKTRYDGDIYLCMGEDMFLCLDKWREARELFSSCHIVCLKRDESSYLEIERKKNEFEREYDADITVLSYEPLPASSTEIREKIKKGENLDLLLSDKVAEYILNNKLYI